MYIMIYDTEIIKVNIMTRMKRILKKEFFIVSDKLSVAILNILQSNTTQLSCHGDQSKLFSFKNKVRKNYLFSFPPNFPFPIYHTQLLIFFCLYNFIIYAREKQF